MMQEYNNSTLTCIIHVFIYISLKHIVIELKQNFSFGSQPAINHKNSLFDFESNNVAKLKSDFCQQ